MYERNQRALSTVRHSSIRHSGAALGCTLLPAQPLKHRGESQGERRIT